MPQKCTRYEVVPNLCVCVCVSVCVCVCVCMCVRLRERESERGIKSEMRKMRNCPRSESEYMNVRAFLCGKERERGTRGLKRGRECERAR